MLRGGYAGRFQPFGKHHRSVVQFIDSQADVEEIIIIKGSSQWSDQNPDPYFPLSRNPFTLGECSKIIRLSLTGRIKKPYQIVAVPDTATRLSDPLWEEWVKDTLVAIGAKNDFNLKDFVLYVNNRHIVRAFSRIGCLCRPFPEIFPVSATMIRKKIAEAPVEQWQTLVDPEVAAYLIEIRGPERIRRLLEEELRNKKPRA